MRSTALIKTHLARTSRRTRNPGFGGGQSNLDVKVSRSLRPSAPKAIRLYVVIPKGWSTNAMPGRGSKSNAPASSATAGASDTPWHTLNGSPLRISLLLTSRRESQAEQLSPTA